ncbi:MAG: hypothetical protein ACUVS4_02155 [Chloroflexaceae bacterium]
MERTACLPLMTARDIERSSTGAEVIVEGVIDAHNPTLFRDFVVYISCSRYDDDGSWRVDELEHRTPSLLIATEDGVVRLANDTYRLHVPPVEWEESEDPRRSSRRKDTKRYQYCGFTPGSPVLLIGRVVDGVEGHAVETEFLFGGTRSEYMKLQRRGVIFVRILGILFGGLGAFILLGSILFFGIWLWLLLSG